jgi:hypothetical protein
MNAKHSQPEKTLCDFYDIIRAGEQILETEMWYLRTKACREVLGTLMLMAHKLIHQV